MSWYIQLAGKRSPALSAAIKLQFDNAANGCKNNPAEVEIIRAQERVVGAAIEALDSATAISVKGGGSHVKHQHPQQADQLNVTLEIATLYGWADGEIAQDHIEDGAVRA